VSQCHPEAIAEGSRAGKSEEMRKSLPEFILSTAEGTQNDIDWVSYCDTVSREDSRGGLNGLKVLHLLLTDRQSAI
jgi:hypothetical protein